MMFMYKTFSLVLLVSYTIQVNNALNSSEICLKPNEFENKCLGKHPFRCDYETCTTNETICESFRTMKKSVVIDLTPFVFQTKIYEFSLYLKKLKKCQYIWDTSDLCMRTSKCTHIHEFKFKNGILNVFEEIPCTCYKLGFQLDCKQNRDYCGRDLISCQGLESFKSNKILFIS